MTKFSEDLHDAQGNFVKTVEWTQIAPAAAAVQVLHPPTFPIDREYARRYDAWAAQRRAQGLPLR